MESRVLGPLEVLADGRSIDLGHHKQRALLALLLINANRVVSTDAIREEIWGNDADGKENTLWVYISRLRSALGGNDLLITRDHGYSLAVEPDSIDAFRFEAALRGGRALLHTDAPAAGEVLGSALELWRGSALQDFEYDEFARLEIGRLEELRLDHQGVLADDFAGLIETSDVPLARFESGLTCDEDVPGIDPDDPATFVAALGVASNDRDANRWCSLLAEDVVVVSDEPEPIVGSIAVGEAFGPEPDDINFLGISASNIQDSGNTVVWDTQFDYLDGCWLLVGSRAIVENGQIVEWNLGELTPLGDDDTGG